MNFDKQDSSTAVVLRLACLILPLPLLLLTEHCWLSQASVAILLGGYLQEMTPLLLIYIYIFIFLYIFIFIYIYIYIKAGRGEEKCGMQRTAIGMQTL